MSYANGKIKYHDNETITMQSGEEKPLVLRNLLSCEDIESLGLSRICPPVPSLSPLGIALLIGVLGVALNRKLRF